LPPLSANPKIRNNAPDKGWGKRGVKSARLHIKSYTALLIYCADCYCSRSVAISADIRSHFSWNKTSVAMMGFRRRFLSAGYFKGTTFRVWSEGDGKM